MATLAKHPLHASWAVHHRAARRPKQQEPSDLRTVLLYVGTLYGVLAFLIAALIAADFLVAWFVTGSAY
jgi:type IV secretory pathway TrbD component